MNTRFTNLIAEPDAEQETVTDAVNDTLKAIAASLLMEQVLAPKFNFRPKNEANTASEGFDYGEEGYDPNKTNVGIKEETGEIQIEITDLVEPKSAEARRVCEQDLNEVVAAYVQDKRTVEIGIFDENTPPQILTQVRMGRIVKERHPDFEDEDVEAVRQRAIAMINMTQQAMHEMNEATAAIKGESVLKPNTAMIDGVRRFAMDVRDVDIDLIDSINPFSNGYSILAKTMDEEKFRKVAAIFAGKRIKLTEEEAKELAICAKKFLDERGRLPSITASDEWEKRMAEGIEFLKQQVRKERTE